MCLGLPLEAVVVLRQHVALREEVQGASVQRRQPTGLAQCTQQPDTWTHAYTNGDFSEDHFKIQWTVHAHKKDGSCQLFIALST